MEAAFPLSICRSFEANAWRSDLCAHCFQSRQEHCADNSSSPASTANPVPGRFHDNATRYQSLMTSYRHSPVAMTTPIPPATAPVGILKMANQPSSKSCRVHFGDDQDVIIGYGGIEFFDDDGYDDSIDGSNGDDDEDFCYTDEDRRVRIHFHSVSSRFQLQLVSNLTTGYESNLYRPWISDQSYCILLSHSPVFVEYYSNINPPALHCGAALLHSFIICLLFPDN